MGLVDRVVEPWDLLGAARRYLERLAETSPPAAIAETKRLVYRHLGTTYEQAVREATKRKYLRPNAVDTLTGKNTGTGAGRGIPYIHCHEWDRP